MKRAFITGGSGFIGTNLISNLQLSGHEVINFDILPPRNKGQNSIWVQGDIRDKSQLENAIIKYQPDIVVHLAARTDLDGSTIDDYSANTVGVRNLVDVIASSNSIKQVLFASSRLVCKIGYTPESDHDYCPTTLYGESKVIGEKIVRESKTKLHCPWIIFRPTSIWGPWFDTPYKEFFMTILHSQYIHPKGNQVKKSFGYVGNSVFQIGKFMDGIPDDFIGKTIYLSDYEPIEVLEWAKLIAKNAGVPAPKEVPLTLLQLLAKSSDLLKVFGMNKPPLTTFRLNNILTDMVYDTIPLQQICGDLPYSNEEGIKATLDWISYYGK
jgi:nucleoside-diphosphate-sugar epimerase